VIRFLALAVTIGFIAVPGLGAVLLFPPGQLHVVARLALIPAMGYAIVVGCAFLLALVGLLRLSLLLPMVTVVAGLLWIRSLRSHSLRDHGRAIRSEVTAERWPLVAGFGVIAAVAAIRLGHLGAVDFTVPFRYWSDGAEIAQAGRIPEFSLHYGALYATTTSKVLFNLFVAATSLVVPNPIMATSSLVWVAAIAQALALWWVGRELGFRLLAPVLPVLAVANHLFLGEEMTRDVESFGAENFGRVVAFCALAMGIRALRGRRPREAVLTGGLFAVAAGTHLVPALVMGSTLCWYAIGLALAEHTWSATKALGRRVGVIVGIAGISTIATLVLAGGDIGFQGARNPSSYEALADGFDPTAYLHTGRLNPIGPDRSWFVSPSGVYRRFVGRAVGIPHATESGVPGAVLVALPLLGLGIAVGMLLWFPPGLRPVGVAAVGMAVTLLAVALFFAYRSGLYMLASFGMRRMFDYAALPLLFAVLAAGEWALEAVRNPGGRLVSAAIVILLLGVIVLPSARVQAAPVTNGSPSVRVLDWIRLHTACGSRLLMDQRTKGVVKVMTGRVGVLEGMGPFLRPAMLDDVVGRLLEARAFFKSPATNLAFLQREGVDYVITLRDVRFGDTAPIGRRSRQGGLVAPFLRLRFTASYADVYEVLQPPEDPAGRGVDVPPTIRCRTSSIDVRAYGGV
jgi:hypothetical protein